MASFSPPLFPLGLQRSPSSESPKTRRRPALILTCFAALGLPPPSSHASPLPSPSRVALATTSRLFWKRRAWSTSSGELPPPRSHPPLPNPVTLLSRPVLIRANDLMHPPLPANECPCRGRRKVERQVQFGSATRKRIRLRVSIANDIGPIHEVVVGLVLGRAHANEKLKGRGGEGEASMRGRAIEQGRRSARTGG